MTEATTAVQNGGTAGTSLDGAAALVAGGTGNVGRYIVGALLSAGARVVVPSRSEEKLEALRAALGDAGAERLVGITGDISDPEDAARVRAEAETAVGPLDAAAASLGGFVPAPSLLEADRAELEAVLDDYLLAHFVAARTFIPAVEPKGGSYTFINGPLAFGSRPGAGLVSIATAGQAMLARALMDETEESGVRVNELVLYTAFGWGDADERSPVSQEQVGRYVAHLASPRSADMAGRTIHLKEPEQVEAVAG